MGRQGVTPPICLPCSLRQDNGRQTVPAAGCFNGPHAKSKSLAAGDCDGGGGGVEQITRDANNQLYFAWSAQITRDANNHFYFAWSADLENSPPWCARNGLFLGRIRRRSRRFAMASRGWWSGVWRLRRATRSSSKGTAPQRCGHLAYSFRMEMPQLPYQA